MAEPDDVLRLIEDEETPPPQDGSRRWKIAVIDDDPAVHEGTRFALSDYRLNGQGLALWRLGRAEEALRVFERILALSPNDNQGVRFCWHDVRAGRTWDEAQARDDAAEAARAEARKVRRRGAGGVPTSN